MESKKTAINAESLFIGSLILIALGVTIIALTPALRHDIKKILTVDSRTILAKISGDLTGSGPIFTILKIQSGEDLFLEIYGDQNADNNSLITKINLAEKRDGYFLLKGNATNLGLTDVDGDGVLEIVAPTFDEQMVARLNIYKYNAQTHSFDRINAPPNGL